MATDDSMLRSMRIDAAFEFFAECVHVSRYAHTSSVNSGTSDTSVRAPSAPAL